MWIFYSTAKLYQFSWCTLYARRRPWHSESLSNNKLSYVTIKLFPPFFVRPFLCDHVAQVCLEFISDKFLVCWKCVCATMRAFSIPQVCLWSPLFPGVSCSLLHTYMVSRCSSPNEWQNCWCNTMAHACPYQGFCSSSSQGLQLSLLSRRYKTRNES